MDNNPTRLFMKNVYISLSQGCYDVINKLCGDMCMEVEKCVDKKNENIFKKYLLNRFYLIN